MRAKNVIVALVVPLTLAALLSPSFIGDNSPSSPEISLPTIVADNPAAISTDSAVIKSQPWDKIDFNSRTLMNNVWGAPEDEEVASSIYLEPGKGFGWSWYRNQPKLRNGDTCLKPIYPNVRIGGSPWEPSATTAFPVKISDLKSLKLEVAYNYPTVPTGSFNLSYDMFLTDTPQPSASPVRKAEIMIWLHRTFPQPQEAYRGDVTDGFNTYEYYSWVMSDGRLYYSFLMKDQSPVQSQYKVDAWKLIEPLKLNPDWYIPGIELGNEVVNGSGKIEISKFTAIVNDIAL